MFIMKKVFAIALALIMVLGCFAGCGNKESVTDLHNAVEYLTSMYKTAGKDEAIVITADLDVLKSVDYLFDMGPEGGKKGGMIVAQGTPEQLAENPDSVTGPFLKEIL